MIINNSILSELHDGVFEMKQGKKVYNQVKVYRPNIFVWLVQIMNTTKEAQIEQDLISKLQDLTRCVK